MEQGSFPEAEPQAEYIVEKNNGGAIARIRHQNVTITARQLKLIERACRQRLRILCAKGQQHLAESFLAAFILKHCDPAVNAHRMRLAETIRWRLAHDSAKLVDLLIVILPTIPGSPETRDTGPEGFNRLFITTGDIAEQGKIQRCPAIELLSPWQNLAASHAEVLCITQQNPGQIIFCTDGKQVAVGRFKLRGLRDTAPCRQDSTAVILRDVLIQGRRSGLLRQKTWSILPILALTISGSIAGTDLST